MERNSELNSIRGKPDAVQLAVHKLLSKSMQFADLLPHPQNFHPLITASSHCNGIIFSSSFFFSFSFSLSLHSASVCLENYTKGKLNLKPKVCQPWLKAK